jgi:hypothetical protein
MSHFMPQIQSSAYLFITQNILGALSAYICGAAHRGNEINPEPNPFRLKN